MASVIAFAPIAAQLARSISLDELVPHGSVEDVLRDHREAAPDSSEVELPSDIQPFFGHYCVVTRAAVQLLGTPAFDGLARFQHQVEDEYMPGGPPMSPVYDSFAMQFVLGAVPQGIGNETPYSVLARLLLCDPTRARLQGLALSLADARLDLYRVKKASGHDAELEPVRGGGAINVRLTGPFLRTGDFGLMRVLEFDEKLFVADSPYLLKAREADWREHLARIVVQQQGRAAAPDRQKARKLSSKEQARRRQKDKAKASRSEPDEIIKRYLRSGLSERYWFDYIMDAYAGERRGMVLLAGVPDRPELLPHSAEYQGAPEPGLPKGLEHSPELGAVLHEVMLVKLRSTLDEPIPQFNGKTLRQLARSVKGRPDAVTWLKEQERILKSNPQLAGFDMRPLWEELALPFQGLETAPSS